jgi:hypothetical protein
MSFFCLKDLEMKELLVKHEGEVIKLLYGKSSYYFPHFSIFFRFYRKDDTPINLIEKFALFVYNGRGDNDIHWNGCKNSMFHIKVAKALTEQEELWKYKYIELAGQGSSI